VRPGSGGGRSDGRGAGHRKRGPGDEIPAEQFILAMGQHFNGVPAACVTMLRGLARFIGDTRAAQPENAPPDPSVSTYHQQPRPAGPDPNVV
jgi:hypothetical protein